MENHFPYIGVLTCTIFFVKSIVNKPCNPLNDQHVISAHIIIIIKCLIFNKCLKMNGEQF